MKPAIIILLFTVIISGGCTTPRHLSYDKLKPHHHVARINQKDYTVVQINFPRKVRAEKNNDYLELYYPRNINAKEPVLLMSIPADDIYDIFVATSNNPNVQTAQYTFLDVLIEFIFFWL